MARFIHFGAAGILTAAAFAVTTAEAASMRCGSHIIQNDTLDGISQYEVLKRCGEPTERYGNTWVYDRPGQMRRQLRFGPDGMLEDIDMVPDE
jgi:hypothetical protein